MNRGVFRLVAGALFCLAAAGLLWPLEADEGILVPGERPTLLRHVDQADIDSGKWSFGRLFDAGQVLFEERFNRLDGAGRPGATGNGVPSQRRSLAPRFTRVSGPEAAACSGCHNQPFAGGAGDFVANVFVGANNLDPVIESVSSSSSNERNTLGMNGSGAIEMLAREMTAELQGERAAALAAAKLTGLAQTAALTAKGVSFGSLIARPDGSVDASGVGGVDADLLIKPFSQKGVVPSIRVFTVNAYNQHHGMEAVERFGVAQTGTHDFDGDGVPDELTAGDITAATIFQVGLGVPGRVLPQDAAGQESAARGEMIFSQIGCNACHVPEMILEDPIFSEPDPYNPPGNLRLADVPHPFTFDLTRDLVGPELERLPDGRAVVRAYTDLKRHVICDALHSYFCNEQLAQNGVPPNEFLTRKLWDVGNTAPYGHRGDIDTIGEAILDHGGEAISSRDAFAALPPESQTDLCNFLKTLQVLPRKVIERAVNAGDARAAASIRAREGPGRP
jgi:Di-haem oxidoreductase, putative peroxidase